MHRRVARWTRSSDDRVTGPSGQPRLSDREHVEPKAVNVPLRYSAFGGATWCIASCGNNVANLHLCHGHQKKFTFLSQKNDLLSRLVINGGVFCPGTEWRKSGTERRKTGQKGWDRMSHIPLNTVIILYCLKYKCDIFKL